MSGEPAIEGGGLKVVFRRLADRYAHRVEWIAPEGAISLLESIEGAADEDWPASPPLQELHFEQRIGGKQLALLVGRAGASHWSLSIELDPATSKIAFDVACRLRSAPAWLGSSYRRLDLVDERVSVLARSGEWQLWPEGDEGRICQLCCHPSELELAPGRPSGPWPQTVRWKYTLARTIASNTPQT